jgi:hypothetical protein
MPRIRITTDEVFPVYAAELLPVDDRSPDAVAVSYSQWLSIQQRLAAGAAAQAELRKLAEQRCGTVEYDDGTRLVVGCGRNDCTGHPLPPPPPLSPEAAEQQRRARHLTPGAHRVLP